MATNILAPTEYTLSKNHRQALLASIPPKIEYPNGIVPFSALEQAIKQCPELENMAPISIEKVHVNFKKSNFFPIEDRYGSFFKKDGHNFAHLNHKCPRCKVFRLFCGCIP